MGFGLAAFLISSAIGIGSDIVGSQKEEEEEARLKREEELLNNTSVEDIPDDPTAKLEAGAKRDELSQSLSMFAIKRDVTAPTAATPQQNPLQIPQG